MKRDGSREPFSFGEVEAAEFAKAAAAEFGVGENRETEFDVAAVKGAAESSKKKGKAK